MIREHLTFEHEPLPVRCGISAQEGVSCRYGTRGYCCTVLVVTDDIPWRVLLVQQADCDPRYTAVCRILRPLKNHESPT